MGQRNIVLLCLDSLRKDYYDEYAPRLQNLGDISFEQCRAASSWSVPSHASMFTGKLPHQHGVHAFNIDFGSINYSDTLIGDLPEHSSYGISSNIFASSSYGFDAWFDDFVEVSPENPLEEGLDVVEFGAKTDSEGLKKYLAFVRAAIRHEHPLASLGNGALVTLDKILAKAPVSKPLDDGAKRISRKLTDYTEQANEPFFAFANLMDIHGPQWHVRGYDDELHNAPKSWTSDDYDFFEVNTNEELGDKDQHVTNHQQLYAASTDYLDRIVSNMVEEILEISDRETTIVITSDHGENLGFPADGYDIEHTSSMSEGLLHVPLTIVNPPEGNNETIRDYVSHLDLSTLIVGLANGAVPDITRDHPPAERIGSIMPSTPHLTQEDEERIKRMFRAVYDGESRIAWDSLGDSARYKIDFDRPNWQEETDKKIEISTWENEYFDVTINEYWEQARKLEENSAVNESVESRLNDLGYM